MPLRGFKLVTSSFDTMLMTRNIESSRSKPLGARRHVPSFVCLVHSVPSMFVMF